MDLWLEMERLLTGCDNSFISVTGGGGKTTFLIEFSSFLKRKGKSVLLTTTTKLASPYDIDYGVDHFSQSIKELKSIDVKKGESTLFATYDEERGKLVSPKLEDLAEICSSFDVVLSEADGSRRKPVKIHTSRDPVIHPSSTGVVAVFGLWALGKKARDVVFGDEGESTVNIDYIQRVILSPEGALKGMREDYVNVLLFNGGDEIDEKTADDISSLTLPSFVKGYIVSEKKGVIYRAL